MNDINKTSFIKQTHKLQHKKIHKHRDHKYIYAIIVYSLKRMKIIRKNCVKKLINTQTHNHTLHLHKIPPPKKKTEERSRLRLSLLQYLYCVFV